VRPLLIGGTRRRDFDGQQMAPAIDEQVAFAPPDVLARIIAFLRTTNRAGFDGLAVNDPLKQWPCLSTVSEQM